MYLCYYYFHAFYPGLIDAIVRLNNFALDDVWLLRTLKNYSIVPLYLRLLNNMLEMVVMTEPLMIKWSIGATLNVTSMINTAMKNCFRTITYHVSMFQLVFYPPNVQRIIVRWPERKEKNKKFFFFVSENLLFLEDEIL